MIPRPYQKRLVSRAAKALDDRGNTLAIAPTGAGKTIMLAMLARKMSPDKTLILQHRDELVAQNLGKFVRVNPDVPTSLYTAETKSWKGRAVFGMVQTLARHTDTIPPLDLLIVDEAHHVAAASYQRIINAAKEANPAVRVAGFTATPARGDGQGLRSVFNNCADQVTIHELIRMGFLVPPVAYVIDVGTREELQHVRRLSTDFDMEEVDRIMNTRPVNDQVIQNWKEKAGDRKTIVFCSTVRHAEDVTKAFQAAGIQAAMVTGDTPAGERRRLLADFSRGSLQVCVNVAVLTEGFDAPPVSCVVLLRPCSFKSTMIQMIGRGLRTVNPDEYPGVAKKDCLVLDFGTSILTHGNMHVMAELKGRADEFEDAETEARYKICPNTDKTDYAYPDPNGNTGCGAEVPVGNKACPFCGFVFARLDGDDAAEPEEVRLTEVDLLNASPFRWVDLFGSGRVLVASGFEAFGLVASKDGDVWHGLGKRRERRNIEHLAVGSLTMAIAAADDYLRNYETEDAAHKSKRWLKDPASAKQLDLLSRAGYQVNSFDFQFTKGTAMAHLNFAWNRGQIERAIGV